MWLLISTKTDRNTRIMDSVALWFVVVYSVLTVSGNALVVLAVIVEKRIRRVTNNIFIASCATNDLLNGVLIIPAVFIEENVVYHWGHYTTALLYIFLGASSATNLSLCCFDRYKYLKDHLIYQQWMNGTKVVLLITCAWLLAAVTTGTCTLASHMEKSMGFEETPRNCSNHLTCVLESKVNHLTFVVICFVPCALATIFWYIRLLLYTETGSIFNLTADRATATVPYTRRTKRASLLGLMTAAYFVCWLPLITTWIMHLTNQKVSEDSLEAVYWLTYVNSLINPLIYVLVNSTIKTAMIRIATCFRHGDYHVTFIDPVMYEQNHARSSRRRDSESWDPGHDAVDSDVEGSVYATRRDSETKRRKKAMRRASILVGFHIAATQPPHPDDFPEVDI